MDKMTQHSEMALINGVREGGEGVAVPFMDARQALFWSVEVLRRRRLPKLSAIWREWIPERVPGEGEDEMVRPEWRFLLPDSAEERLLLALKVLGVVETLGEEGRLLKLQAWGDWADEGRLQRALRFQEKMRREGVRVLINYRYTFRQLAEMHGMPEMTVWRRVRRGLRALERELVVAGLVVGRNQEPGIRNQEGWSGE